MRKSLVGLLLGAVVMGAPAAAQRWQERGADDVDRTQTREDRQEARGNRQDGRDDRREAQGQRPDAGQGRPGPHEGLPDSRPGDARLGRGDAPRDRPPVAGVGSVGRADWQRDPRRDGGDGARDVWRNGRDDGRGDPGERRRDWREDRPGARPGRPDFRDDRRNDAGRFDRPPAYRGGYGGAARGGWDRGWRNDRRYDWQGYRQGNRNIFRAPRYYAPRGYAGSYRRWSPGYRLQPFFYAQSYWISDPFYYRLPPVDGPYRWVRYYGDVLLIDIRSGEVVDAVYDFFG